MSNIIRLAPYAYLAKRSGGGTLYDLLVLIPVDANGDTDLSNVNPVKRGGTTITIDYTTTGSAAGVAYRFKHWLIDSEGTYENIEIQGDNNADRTTVVVFDDADLEQAVITNQQQTCAPYLFAQIETVGSQKFVLPSCIMLFDNGIGVQSETIIFASHSCSPTFNLGNSNAATDPTTFTINKSVKGKLTQGVEYTFEVDVPESTSLNKPPRKAIRKVFW